MSKRAEAKAMEAYPPTYTTVKRHAKRVQSELVDTHKPVRAIFQQGYEQAEKDNALTWEDIYSIIYIYLGIIRDKYFRDAEPEILCKELLRKFNEQYRKK